MGVAGQMFACLIACFHLLKTAIYFNKFAITQIIKSLIRPKWTQPRRSGSALLGNGKLGPPFGDRSRTGAWRASGCPVFDPWDPKELCWATKEIRVGGGFPASCNTIQCFPHRPAPTYAVNWHYTNKDCLIDLLIENMKKKHFFINILMVKSNTVTHTNLFTSDKRRNDVKKDKEHDWEDASCPTTTDCASSFLCPKSIKSHKYTTFLTKSVPLSFFTVYSPWVAEMVRTVDLNKYVYVEFQNM